MSKKINVIVLIFGFSPIFMNAQEDAVRFFNLETKPTISVLYDQTYKRKIKPIRIPMNIYARPNKRRTINMAEQVQRKEYEQEYLAQIYQSRIDKQQFRISENYRSTLKKKDTTIPDAEFQFRNPYNNQAYGWQNNYYNSSRLWRPSFYQGTNLSRMRTNQFIID